MKTSLSNNLRKLRKALHLLRTAEYRRGLWRGIGAAIEHEKLLATLEIKTVVDIGANVGQFSLLCAAVYPQATIFAFEPLSEPARKCGELFRNRDRFTLSTCAIGSTEGEATMHVSRRDDSSSLLPISDTLTEVFPGTDEVGTVRVAMAPLRVYVEPTALAFPALLKIDVQGGELEVLRGCEDLLDRFSYVYVELSFVELYTGQPLCQEIIRFLDHHRFVVVGVNNVSYDQAGRPLQADFLFSRNAPAA